MDLINVGAYRQVDTESGTIFEPGELMKGVKETQFVKDQLAAGGFKTVEDALAPKRPDGAAVDTTTGREEKPIINPEVQPNGDKADAAQVQKDAEANNANANLSPNGGKAVPAVGTAPGTTDDKGNVVDQQAKPQQTEVKTATTVPTKKD